MTELLRPDGAKAQPTIARIYEIDIPLPTTDVEELKKACLVPVYQPGVAVMGTQSALVKSPDGKQGQVMVGHAQGFTGGEALIVRETAAALDDLRAQIAELRALVDVNQKGLRVSLEVNEQLATQARVGQDGLTSSRLRDIADGVRELRLALFPDDPPEIKSG